MHACGGYARQDKYIRSSMICTSKQNETVTLYYSTNLITQIIYIYIQRIELRMYDLHVQQETKKTKVHFATQKRILTTALSKLRI